MTNNISYSVVVPVFNTSTSLFKLVKSIIEIFQTEVKESFELILVDDCSTNLDTSETLKKIASYKDNIIVIQLSRNFGQHPATLCGIQHSSGNYIITLDDDLQHNPGDIPKLIEKKAHDVVIGCFKKKEHSIFRRFVSRIKGWFDYQLIGKPKNIKLTPYRLINRMTADNMLRITTPYPFIPALIFYVTKDVVNIELEHNKRIESKSGYSLFKLVSVFSNLLINNSSFLLRLVGGGGICLSIISLCMSFYFLINRLFFHTYIAGWTSVIVSVLFVGGTSLFTLGLIGEYLIRIIQTVEQKPTFIVRRIIGRGE